MLQYRANRAFQDWLRTLAPKVRNELTTSDKPRRSPRQHQRHGKRKKTTERAGHLDKVFGMRFRD